jgi:hypothetical protein
MNEKLSNATVEPLENNSDNPELKWQMVCKHGSMGRLTLPFCSRMGAKAVAAYINKNGLLPEAGEDCTAARVMAFELAGKRDVWVPASGGLEWPCMRKGRRVLYCWNPARREHCYIDLETDMPIED